MMPTASPAFAHSVVCGRKNRLVVVEVPDWKGLTAHGVF